MEEANGTTGKGTQAMLHRVAVGEHLILGGDNLDLAIAKAVESRLVGEQQLAPREWDALRLQCRVAKEALLGEHAPSQFVITLKGSGSKLIASTRSLVLESEWLHEILLNGFFPAL